MSNVIQFNGATTQEIDPDQVLQQAVGKCVDVLVIGFESDGSLYFAGSTGEVGNILTLMELAKFQLLSGFVE